MYLHLPLKKALLKTSVHFCNCISACISTLKNIYICLLLFCSIVKGVYQEPLGVHYVMFIPTLNSQCTAEQRKKWIPLAESFHMLGTYAQTELGHGQFLSQTIMGNVYFLYLGQIETVVHFGFSANSRYS